MDPTGREEMLDLVRRIGATGKTIIVSSHILQEVERVCGHAVIISDGRLVRDGKMGALMAGEEGLQNLTVRGDAKALEAFSQALGAACAVVRRADEGVGQVSFSVRSCGDGRRIFALAKQHRIQVRSYTPDRMSLEDVFLQAFQGGGRSGD
jgi:ABC-2 type transport system ATP-binding protein